MNWWIERPADTDLIVLWKVGRNLEVAYWELSEARRLLRELEAPSSR